MNKNNYLIIGNGRVAKHLKHYFKCLNIQFNSWSRSSDLSLPSLIQHSTIILLAISDSSIEQFILDNNSTDKVWIHFSGSLYTELAIGIHPLMTFTDNLYSLQEYKAIPFIIDTLNFDFEEVFPQLENKFYFIDKEKKAEYHLWASMAGNFTSIMWKNYLQKLNADFGFPKEIAFPFLNKISDNLFNTKNPVTGPIARKDILTIKKHLEIVENTPYKTIYDGFLELNNIQVERLK